MGMWDYVSWATDSVRQRLPDLTSVKGFARSSYDHSWAAATKIDNAVRIDAVGMLNHQFSDPETRSYLLQLGKNCVLEGSKIVPAVGPVVKIVSKSVGDVQKSKKCEGLQENKIKGREELEVVKASLSRMEKEVNDLRRKIEVQRLDVEMKSQKDGAEIYRNPEDVIRVFMMKEFVGTHMLDDLMVPHIKSRKNSG